MAYRARLADGELDRALARAGAVLIEGPKACGKTETAARHAHSRVSLDVDPGAASLISIDPTLVLEGPRPRLLDEWQIYPQLWNFVRHAVDEARGPGQFILTGSTAPSSDAVRHSGAGRVARMRMRTMTLAETWDSDARVSLESVLNGEPPRAPSPLLDFDSLLRRIARGGWPGFLNLSDHEAAIGVRDYAETVATVDIGTAGTDRDPTRVLRLMAALARNVATEVKISTLASDEASLSRDAVREYLDALHRIFVIEDQPAWSTHLRSAATLRKEPKRHFCDPSLALALVRADAGALRSNLGYAGQLFESLVIHDLRVLSEPLQATVMHARDSDGREVDAILQRPDGSWAGFEVKLGASKDVLDAAAHSLLAFARTVDASPSSLTVITSTGPSYRRSDGVNVVSVGSLGA